MSELSEKVREAIKSCNEYGRGFEPEDVITHQELEELLDEVDALEEQVFNLKQEKSEMEFKIKNPEGYQAG